MVISTEGIDAGVKDLFRQALFSWVRETALTLGGERDVLTAVLAEVEAEDDATVTGALLVALRELVAQRNLFGLEVIATGLLRLGHQHGKDTLLTATRGLLMAAGRKDIVVAVCHRLLGTANGAAATMMLQEVAGLAAHGGLPEWAGMAYEALGRHHLERSETPLALLCFDTAIQAFRKADRGAEVARLGREVARLHEAAGNREAAAESWQEAAKCAEDASPEAGVADWLEAARLWLVLGKARVAARALARADKLLGEVDAPELERRVWEGMAEAHRGDAELAASWKARLALLALADDDRRVEKG